MPGGTEQNSKVTIQMKLNTAMRYVQHVCVIGSDNDYLNHVKTGGWSFFQFYRYRDVGQYLNRKAHDQSLDASIANKFNKNHSGDKNKGWFYSPGNYVSNKNSGRPVLIPRIPFIDPLNDSLFSINDNQRSLLEKALFVIERRHGNCLDRACLLAKYLWEHPGDTWDDVVINRIEIVNTATFDHAFVIVNRKNGDLHDPKTWGDAWIIDPWYHDNENEGIIYRPEDFETMINRVKKFAIQQIKDYAEKAGIKKLKPVKGKEHIGKVLYEIKPFEHTYPAYLTEVFQPLEFYYEVKNAYTSDLQSLQKDKKSHEAAMGAVLPKIIKK